MAVRVIILKDLETRLRAWHNGEKKDTPEALIGALVKLLDEVYAKRETGSKAEGGSSHLGYKGLVSLFRSYLGSDLVLPPNPSSTWIIKNLALARNMGVSSDNVEQICKGLRRQYPRGPYQLGFILGRADVHFAAGQVNEDGEKGPDDLRSAGNLVHTGRIWGTDEGDS